MLGLHLLLCVSNVASVMIIPQSDTVPFVSWQCGTDERMRRMSYEIIYDECFDVLIQFNNCCSVHDQCYLENLGQTFCDDAFCKCLNAAVQEAKNADNCHQNAFWACFAVRIFGSYSYLEAQNQTAHEDGRIQQGISTSEMEGTPTSKSLPETVICAIDDPLASKHYEEAVEVCAQQKTQFSECCEQHTTCHWNLSIHPLSCHRKFGECLRGLLKDSVEGGRCYEALELVYGDLIGGEEFSTKEGFFYSLQYWLNQLRAKTGLTSVANNYNQHPPGETLFAEIMIVLLVFVPPSILIMCRFTKAFCRPRNYNLIISKNELENAL
ncbi:hypothetical protein AB6A40_003360 [Gnathostoma spinigerum]|uniref:Uncharacterized protein n=1 Tax=Gnathostoma spinigerum TaxID=75299 RepID=A0ABD6EBT3_9BILA